MTRRTKIVCTIGPASDSEEMIAKLIAAGMNVARLNFSHGTTQYQRDLVRKIKQVRKALNKPVAILQDLQGPKIRIGEIDSGFVQLQPGQEFILTANGVSGDANRVAVRVAPLAELAIAAPSEARRGAVPQDDSGHEALAVVFVARDRAVGFGDREDVTPIRIRVSGHTTDRISNLDRPT